MALVLDRRSQSLACTVVSMAQGVLDSFDVLVQAVIIGLI